MVNRKILFSVIGGLVFATLSGAIMCVPSKKYEESIGTSNTNLESYDGLSNVSFLRRMSDSDFYAHKDGENLELKVKLFRVLLGENHLDDGIANLGFCCIGKDDEQVYASGYYYVYKKDRKKLKDLLDLCKDPYNLPRLDTNLSGKLIFRPIPDIKLSTVDVEGIGKINLYRLPKNPFKDPEFPLETYLPQDDSAK